MPRWCSFCSWLSSTEDRRCSIKLSDLKETSSCTFIHSLWFLRAGDSLETLLNFSAEIISMSIRGIHQRGDISRRSLFLFFTSHESSSSLFLLMSNYRVYCQYSCTNCNIVAFIIISVDYGNGELHSIKPLRIKGQGERGRESEDCKPSRSKLIDSADQCQRAFVSTE